MPRSLRSAHRVIFATALAMLPGRVIAQAPAYHAPADTVYMALVNPYRMFWVRGADTLGGPVRDITVERQLWRKSGDRLVVLADQHTLNVTRRVTLDTLTIAPDGRLLLVGTKPPGPTGRVDFLLHLPKRPIAKGVEWSDTLDTSSGGSEKSYRVERRYRVAGPVDSLGRHLVRVDAEGKVRYRDGWWADSTRGLRVGMDVAGPVHESFLFDPAAGQLVSRSWKMELRGRGTIPRDSTAVDSVPAGLDASEDHIPLTPAAARLALRELPGADSSITTNGRGPILLHTVRRSSDSLASALARNDGLIGTARVRFANALPVEYAAQWTEGIEPPSERRVRVAGDSLVVGSERGDTTIAIPRPHWGIADYGMEESLVPAILALAGDTTTTPFAVYRPYARRWDTGVVKVQRLEGGVVAFLILGESATPHVLVISDDGDLLYVFQSGPGGAERAPPAGSPRRARLEAMLSRLQGR